MHCTHTRVFAVRGNLSDPAWRTASDTAFNEGVKFFNTHLLAPAAPAAGAPAAAAKAAAAPAAGVPAAAAPAAKAATAAPARAAAGMATAPKP